MVYDRSRRDLISFQRWVVTGLYRVVPWDEYRRETKSAESVAAHAATARAAAEHALEPFALEENAP
jgi:hypothetical protein